MILLKHPIAFTESIFDVPFEFVVCTSLDEFVRDEYPEIIGTIPLLDGADDNLDEGLNGLCFFEKGRVVAVVTDDATTKVVVHEVLHGANMLYSITGCNMDIDEDELHVRIYTSMVSEAVDVFNEFKNGRSVVNSAENESANRR